jgi:putative ABC transport system permease protein
MINDYKFDHFNLYLKETIMLNLTIKNIMYKKTRSILTILGIVIAMQLYIVLSGIMNAYDKDMQKQVASMAGKIFVQAKTEGTASMLPMQNVINESIANKLEQLEGIDASLTTKILYNEVIAAQAPNMPPLVFVAGVEKGKEESYFGNLDVEGKDTNSKDNDVILGATAALWAEQEQKVKLNDTITLNGEKFTVVGILPPINMSIDSTIVMPLKTAQNLYNKQGIVNALMITATKVDKIDDLAKLIEKTDDSVIASTSKEVQKSADQMLAGQRGFFDMINGTIIFVAIFMVMIIMIMAIHERKKEIGTLKAIGASYSKVLFMVMAESTILSVIGGLIALPTSILFSWVVGGRPSDLETLLTFNDPADWPMILVVTIIIGVVSGILPALSARKVNPLESIRYE